MAALVEGHQYGLSSGYSTSSQKTVIHCKLTDSALKAIEEFKRTKGSATLKPNIQFKGSDGVIKIPIQKTSDRPEEERSFQFSLSTIPLDPKGSFECIRQNDASRNEELEMLGAMLHKVSVRGSDDSYGRARESMKLAEEESKKQRAKEIKPSGPNIGRRVKKIGRVPPVAPSPSVPQQRQTPASFKSSQEPPHTRPSTFSVESSQSNSQIHVRPSAFSHVSKPALSSNQNSANRASAVMNMPFRDRVIHLLAIRSYKKPELYIRIQKDGMKDKDRTSLGAVLNQVGYFNPRDNSYTLAKHLYSEVRSDWPYYTETDRQLLKRKLSQLNEPSLSTTTSPAVSPCHSTGSQGSPNSSQKRGMEEEKISDQPPKKQRVAHHNQHQAAPESTSKGSSWSSTNKPTKSSPNPVSPESPGTGNQENNNLLEEMSLDDKPDYLKKYNVIRQTDQRQKYKVDFNHEYDEYRKLHAVIDKVTNKFTGLKEQLMRQERDSSDYRNIRKRIMCEYKQVKEDPKYLEQRRRHDYLHRKLGHIKKLISDFDQARLITPAS